MQDSLAAGRRCAVRLILGQAAGCILVSLLFLLMRGADYALAALVGGGLAVAGTALMGWRVFRPEVVPAGIALLRLLGGLLLKWLVVLGGFLIVLTRTGLPPLALLAGLGSALFAFVVSGYWLKVKEPLNKFRGSSSQGRAL